MDIRKIDQQILSLFKQRIKIADNQDDKNVNRDTIRLLEQMIWVAQKRDFPVSNDWKENYVRYQNALIRRRNPVVHPKVIYQGEPGAYSEMAAIDFFGEDVQMKGLYQFQDVFEALHNKEADYAVLPIENTSTGAIRQVYDLLMQYGLLHGW